MTLNFPDLADDTTTHNYGKHWDEVMINLEKKLASVFQWLTENIFKANTEECHHFFLVLFCSPFSRSTFNIHEYAIGSSHSEGLLEITIDSNLTFEEYVKSFSRESNQKLHGLSNVVNYVILEQRRVIMNSFIFSQFH